VRASRIVRKIDRFLFASACFRQPSFAPLELLNRLPHDIGKPRLRASWRIRRAFLSVGLFPQCTYRLQLLRAYHELLVELDR